MPYQVYRNNWVITDGYYLTRKEADERAKKERYSFISTYHGQKAPKITVKKVVDRNTNPPKGIKALKYRIETSTNTFFSRSLPNAKKRADMETGKGRWATVFDNKTGKRVYEGRKKNPSLNTWVKASAVRLRKVAGKLVMDIKN